MPMFLSPPAWKDTVGSQMDSVRAKMLVLLFRLLRLPQIIHRNARKGGRSQQHLWCSRFLNTVPHVWETILRHALYLLLIPGLAGLFGQTLHVPQRRGVSDNFQC